MNTLTRVTVITIGSLLSFTGAASAHYQGRHALTSPEYSGFQSRAEWQETGRSRFAVRPQPVINDFVAKPEGNGQPGSP